jgi:hypothetical protein
MGVQSDMDNQDNQPLEELAPISILPRLSVSPWLPRDREVQTLLHESTKINASGQSRRIIAVFSELTKSISSSIVP